MTTIVDKIEHSKELIAESVKKYEKIAVASSFGKDSITTVHLSRKVDPDISVFSVMTIYKPLVTLEYLVEMNRKMNLDVTVYIVADEAPEILKKNGIKVVTLPTARFKEAYECEKREKGRELYETYPDLCCELLKVEPTKVAVKNLDAWIAGLRKTEGSTRENLNEVEHRGNIVKINPVLEWTELDIWRYLAINNIPVNPLYKKGYRSLGCEPCSVIVSDDEPERAGRWQGTSKCGGECGIHTKTLK